MMKKIIKRVLGSAAALLVGTAIALHSGCSVRLTHEWTSRRATYSLAANLDAQTEIGSDNETPAKRSRKAPQKR
jgi:hypothetical protein